MRIKEAIIYIKLPIKVSEYIRNFIFKNINMRRQIWNDFVEVYESNKKENEEREKRGEEKKEFRPLQYKTDYFREKEQGRYDEYCVGLSEQVAIDMHNAMKTIKTNNKKVLDGKSSAKLGELKFHKRDNYHGSFKVGCKTYETRSNNISSRVHILDKNTLSFRVRGKIYGHEEEILTIHLKEDLYDDVIPYDKHQNEYIRYYKDNPARNECRFRDIDVRMCTFIHELGKFYIQLAIRVLYCIDKENIKSRYKKLGIDTGIHNPFMCYDGEHDIYTQVEMDNKTSRKIHYLERRARRIQHAMDKKYNYNIEHGLNPYSNNYKKLLYKFRKIWKKIVNIKRHWSYNVCKKIVTHYKTIVVDRFNTPDNKDKDIPNKLKRHIDYVNRFHGMYTTNDILVHMANKYGCEYIKAPKNTTCTCSMCGHKNPHLPLSQRIFKCEECGYEIDRDMNAAKNCYYM